MGKGDVRAATLLLLAEQPLHGYQIIHLIEEQSNGLWRPSADSVYPALQLLEDEGLVQAEPVEGRRVYHLTEVGRAYVEERRDELTAARAAVTATVGEGWIELHDLLRQVNAALTQVAQVGTPGQRAAAGALLARTRGLRETLPHSERHSGGVGATLRTLRALLTERAFMGVAVAAGLSFATMFAYISGSSFVYQQVYGVSAQSFSLLFGLNALGIVVASQVSRCLVGRVTPRRRLAAGLCTSAAGSLALLGAVLAGLGLAAVAASLFVVVASRGCILPNATALALAGQPRTAESASALLGVTQFAIAAALGPLVGLGGAGARPMAGVIVACALGALLMGLRAPDARSAGPAQS